MSYLTAHMDSYMQGSPGQFQEQMILPWNVENREEGGVGDEQDNSGGFLWKRKQELTIFLWYFFALESMPDHFT